jgi:hypothetical protein
MKSKFNTDENCQLLRSSRDKQVIRVWKTGIDQFSYSPPGQSFDFGKEELNGWEVIESSNYLGENPDFPRHPIAIQTI